MKIGAFSVSLSVKDIGTSKMFYENLGFNMVGGEISENWVIMRNTGTTIGLFQGMFEGNLMTFNPGWDKNGYPVESYTDVREIQASLKSKGIGLLSEIDLETKGPASFMVADPDGNVILFDQHV